MGHQSVLELTHAAAAAVFKLRLRQFCVGSGDLTLQPKKTISGGGAILVGR